ncbi:hypothetical protein PCANB_002097 [Pneumocystis canis]|nr:hypothetical protein PCK1_001822 [Pneumocystis canis]KAG5439522.1 hypothetical protein PCANB_002097 [Pneumocystis canis]
MLLTVIEESNKNSKDTDNESSDDDFVLDGSNGEHDSELSDTVSEIKYDSGDEKVINTFKKENRKNGDFSREDYNNRVKTRSQNIQNEKVVKCIQESSLLDIDAIWNNMNEKKTVKGNNYYPINSSEEKVKISRTYEFAGKVETEERFVLKDSAEARMHFSSINLVQTDKPLLRKSTKRVSSLEVANNRPVKLNTLEKSRLDWAKFIDKEGIANELKNASKDGYMDKQMFLQVAEERMIKNIKEAMKK